MTHRLAAAAAAAALFVQPFSAAAQSADRTPVDPQIRSMVAAVSAARLRDYDTGLLKFGTRNTFSEQSADPNRGVFAARNWVRAQFEAIATQSGRRMTVAYDEYTQPKLDFTPRAALISSVVATLRGDDPGGRTYVISSHYDSRNSSGSDALKDAPGADDNGSGVACVLEAARVMAAHHFRATVIFAAYDGEEQGLFGSSHHAKVLHDAGVDVEGNLNNDIIGASRGHFGEKDPFEVRLFSEALPPDVSIKRINTSGGEDDSPARELARFVKSVDAAYVPSMKTHLIYRSDRFSRGGDQQSFAAAGFAAVRFVEPHEDYVHQHQDLRVENGVAYGDVQKYVDFEYLARVTRMNVAALATLALGPAKPQRVEIVLPTVLTYDTELRWSAVPGAASYEIVWRDTTAPLWEHVLNVGNVTDAHIKVSKDDYLFGVRAVDASGHRTPAVYPSPVRE